MLLPTSSFYIHVCVFQLYLQILKSHWLARLKLRYRPLALKRLLCKQSHSTHTNWRQLWRQRYTTDHQETMVWSVTYESFLWATLNTIFILLHMQLHGNIVIPRIHFVQVMYMSSKVTVWQSVPLYTCLVHISQFISASYTKWWVIK